MRRSARLWSTVVKGVLLAAAAASCGSPAGRGSPAEPPSSASLESIPAVEPEIAQATVPATTDLPLTTPLTTLAGLPSAAWDVEGLTVTLDIPDDFLNNPQATPVSDIDRANGLLVLESWIVRGVPRLATLSIQEAPAPDSPQMSAPGDDEIVVGDLRWKIFGDLKGEPTAFVNAFATSGSYLLNISGDASTVVRLTSALSVEERSE